MSNLISAKECISLEGQENVAVFDCRFELSDPGFGRRLYLEGHIPGAVYVSLDELLTSSDRTSGGRHPLPEIAEMAEVFSAMGIERNVTRVIAYDDMGSCFAARLWWMLRYLGHDTVQVLDGGYTAYRNAGGGESRDIPQRPRMEFIPDPRDDMRVTLEYLQREIGTVPLVDARLAERYRGEIEPIDPKAGHIPQAQNMYWMESLNPDGTFLSKERLRERFRHLPERPVMYCGSGVTACVNVLAYEEAGYAGVRFYTGGWSEWISDPENAVAIGEDTAK